MARPRSNHPTDGEMIILQSLWEHGPSTVRQIHERLIADRTIGYTTVLKTLQIMTEKGLVLRKESGRSHVYRAAKDESLTQRKLLRSLIERVFGGSTRQLILHALSAKKSTPEELKEIRRLIEETEEREK